MENVKNMPSAIDVGSADDLGDWRIAAASRLAKDLPAAYPGGPSHKAGTAVYQASLVKTKQGDLVSFTTPSAVALALNLAIRASQEATRLHSGISYREVLTPDGIGRGVEGATSHVLYDFFEQCMLSAVFSFQALEAFCNQIILQELHEAMEVKRRDKRVVLAPIELERQLSTSEKLSLVIPKVRKLPTPKGKVVWEPYKRLQEARDATVHLKAHDQYSTDHESLFFQFLSHKAAEFPKAAADMIRYFYPAKDAWPRWLSRLPL
jgi:hypothetical protein